jgi:gliding motility-associated lipoprotein GldJ
MKTSRFLAVSTLAAMTLLLASCAKQKSGTTGWGYNDPKNGGFQVTDYTDQKPGPGLVLITGGTFVMGSTQDNYFYDWDNKARKVTVRSFYMDITEVANVDYLEYLYWLNRVFGADYPEVYRKALPDTLVWRDRLAYNEPLVELYLRHPAYHYYPVVGVNWIQATDYCAWRTDRVNELILVEKGILDLDPDQVNENNFNTDAYLAGQYEGLVNRNLEDLNPSGTGERRVKLEDGILLPRYRLPTEAEWEYAALGLIGNTLYERVMDRKNYPWSGHTLRTDDKEYYGNFITNFKRGKGDYMGVAEYLNDSYAIPAPVVAYWPNDYGLYNMAGNVAEWVMDVYRPLSLEDVSDINPYRGNVFMQKIRDSEHLIVEKDEFGKLKMESEKTEDLASRRNYRKAYNKNYIDGDLTTSIYKDDWGKNDSIDSKSENVYDYEHTTMINDKVRIYKGGSWKDKAYWLSPGTRRFLDEEVATDYIGFRCAMDRVGAPVSYY